MVDDGVIKRVHARLAEAIEAHRNGTVADAALEEARETLETLARAAAELERELPGRVEEAVREGVRAEAAPVARMLAELRGLTSLLARRLEGIGADLSAERRARVEDLALLVELVSSGWQGVDARLERIEHALAAPADALRNGSARG